MPRLILSPRNLLEDVRASFWALPVVGMILAIALAWATHTLDVERFAGSDAAAGGFVGSVHVDTVRQLLATLAAAAAGTTGIAFSITITTLALASQQFGPHVLRTYMQRRFVQLVLAGFIATVLYALLSLHWLGAAARVDYLPVATAATSLALTAMDLLLLVLFVHVTATSIQAESVLEAVHEEHLNRLPDLFPGPVDGPGPAAMDGSDIDDSLGAGTGHKMVALRSGYLQSIDRARLVALAARHDVRIAVAHEPGVWVTEGVTLATVHAPPGTSDGPSTGGADEASADATNGSAAGSDADMQRLERRVRSLIVLGTCPTPEQDPRFALRQLQQIALRALSPGINDPQTAASCLFRIGAIASDLLGRDDVRRRFPDGGGTVRLVERRSGPDRLLDFAFDAIVRASDEHPNTVADLVRTLDTLARLHPGSPWLGTLDAQLERIARGLERASHDPVDAERLTAAVRRARARVATAMAAGPRAGAPVSPTTDAAARESGRVTSSRGGAAF